MLRHDPYSDPLILDWFFSSLEKRRRYLPDRANPGPTPHAGRNNTLETHNDDNNTVFNQ